MGLGIGLENQSNNNNQQFLGSDFTQNNDLNAFSDNNNLFMTQQGQTFAPSGLDSNGSFGQSQDFSNQFKQEAQSPFNPQAGSFTQDLLGANLSPNFNGGDFSLFPNTSGQTEQFDQAFFLNETSDPASTLNPAQLDMPSPQTHNPTPPHLLQPDSHTPSSAQHSPAFNQGHFQHSPSHSRHASLGPESAAFPQGGVDWSMMPRQFQGHRRTPSEYSDVSASSAAHSPHLGHHDSAEHVDHRHSPMQHPQDSNLYNDVLAIGAFSLSDPQIQHGSSPGRGLSPAHSPAISPRLSPQQTAGLNQPNNFMLGVGNFGNPQNIYGSNLNSFPQVQHGHGSLDMGQAQQMVPPEIQVEFAPASRQNSFEPPKPSLDQDALSPPERGKFDSMYLPKPMLTIFRTTSSRRLRSL
jgi:hypothetical protein